jgi:hypothetical protein
MNGNKAYSLLGCRKNEDYEILKSDPKKFRYLVALIILLFSQ